MQQWEGQASKNGLVIEACGPCQLCGSATRGGLSECVEKAALITHRLNHAEGVKHASIFLCVDSHALQHPEIHGRWNNHFHLARLDLILRRRVQWRYEYSPLLSAVLHSYKAVHATERIMAPDPTNRGSLTVMDVEAACSAEAYIALTEQWAEGVFESYDAGRDVAERVAQEFIDRFSPQIHR